MFFYVAVFYLAQLDQHLQKIEENVNFTEVYLHDFSYIKYFNNLKKGEKPCSR
jgi:hypothetical protein